MLHKAVYQNLENKFPKYADLKSVKTIESHEPLVSVASSGIKYSTTLDGIEPSSGEQIYIRSSVLQKLERAQKYLNECEPNIYLEVFYGWRSPTIQKNAFDAMRKQLSSSNITIDDIHKFIAVPDVAGHPTGGAVDIRLIDKQGVAFDMGTAPHEFTMKSYVFAPNISNEAYKNRQALRAAMVSADFAPFDGEWWHFSYGDKEWAYFWNMPYAIYDQIECVDFK
jgi:D-alanyl-D-alanine dipeptidase